MSNPTKPASMFEEGAQQFKELRKESGRVESLCNKSIRLENSLTKLLRRFIKASLLALRAARALVPTFPSDEKLLEYLHDLVRSVFADVTAELAASEKKD